MNNLGVNLERKPLMFNGKVAPFSQIRTMRLERLISRRVEKVELNGNESFRMRCCFNSSKVKNQLRGEIIGIINYPHGTTSWCMRRKQFDDRELLTRITDMRIKIQDVWHRELIEEAEVGMLEQMKLKLEKGMDISSPQQELFREIHYKLYVDGEDYGDGHEHIVWLHPVTKEPLQDVFYYHNCAQHYLLKGLEHYMIGS